MADNLPTFLGIGAMRSGTSWLYVQLKSHSQIYLPENVKEIHYFDNFYDRGIEWYRSFFQNEAASFKAIGEITPKYIFDEAVPDRVKQTLPEANFIAMLRNPADRAYSNYTMSYSHGSLEGRTFNEFIRTDKTVFDRGLYSAQLERWLKLFPEDRFLVLIYEEVMQNPDTALMQIADFLKIDHNEFQHNSTSKKINASHAPRFPKAYVAGIKLRNYFRERDLHFLSTTVIKIGKLVRIVFGSNKNTAPPFSSVDRQNLIEKYSADITRLESILGRKLDLWRK